MDFPTTKINDILWVDTARGSSCQGPVITSKKTCELLDCALLETPKKKKKKHTIENDTDIYSGVECATTCTKKKT
jgi:hypothetical protein